MFVNEIVPATHTETEWKVVPMSYIHLKKGDVVIHKKPSAFLERKGRKVTYKQMFDEDTGRDWTEEIVKEFKRPPAADLKDYFKDGWERCNRDGSEILNRDGSSKETPGPKPIKGDA